MGSQPPPQYFSEFLEECREKSRADRDNIMKVFDRLCLSIEALSKRVSGLETRLDATVLKQSADTFTLSADISAVRAEVSSLSLSITSIDPCETVFSDIPTPPQLTHPQIASHVLSNMGLDNLDSHIIEVRPWLGARSNGPSPPISSPLSSPSPPINPSQQIPTPLTSLVVKFASPMARDSVLAKANKLHKRNNTDLSSILGSNHNHTQNQTPRINALWPKPIYLLWRKALAACRLLNYERPLLRNLIVRVRETRNSPLIPIFTEEKLAALPIRQPCSTQSLRLPPDHPPLLTDKIPATV